MERKNVDKFWYLDRGTGQRRKLSFTERWMVGWNGGARCFSTDRAVRTVYDVGRGSAYGTWRFSVPRFYRGVFVLPLPISSCSSKHDELVLRLRCACPPTHNRAPFAANETAKWDDVHEAMEGGKELVVRKPKAGSSGAQRAPPVVDQGSQINVDGLRARRAALSRKKDDEKDTEDSSERPESRAEDEAIGDVDAEWETTVIRSYDDLESLYNRGWLANLWEVLFPDSV